ncbi:hypothetical protein [Lacrimispora sp.]|uniref:hypothetical protein n=1 Tax=Lacrimispora sp. TaxID=2719234 RepID=UPI002FD958BE
MKKVKKIISSFPVAVIVATPIWHAPPAIGALNIPSSFLAEEYAVTSSGAIRER